MKTFNTLLLREWMQHRFGWAMLVLVPLGLAVLVLSVGQVQIGADSGERVGDFFPTMLAAISMIATTGVVFSILTLTSLILVSGLARRDHGDRSVEFWLSMPTPHSSTFGAPLLTHLVLVPVAALAVGALSGLLVSMILVGRVVSLGAWVGLPWGELLTAAGALFVRFAVGVPLAMLWLMPLILAMVLLGAWLKRWGLPVLLLGLTVVTTGARQLMGVTWPADALQTLLMQAGRSLFHTQQQGFQVDSSAEAQAALASIPGFFLGDIGPALSLLASPAFLTALAVSAGLFWLLLDWRRRGAGGAG